MIDLKAFRKANDLTQQDLAKILGVSRSFVAQVESGHSKMPDVYVDTLIKSEYDTSLLVTEDNYDKDTIAVLKAKIDMLTEQLAEARTERDKYWELIITLNKR